MEYGLPQPEAPPLETTPPPTSAWLHPGCLGLVVAAVVAVVGCLAIYLALVITKPGWGGLTIMYYGLIAVVVLTVVSFFIGVAWGMKSRQSHRMRNG